MVSEELHELNYFSDDRANERFHLFPKERLSLISVLASCVGGFSGLSDGIKMSSLRFLAENGHRLPRNVAGWYFYHKKKNYIMIKEGIKQGIKQGTGLSIVITSFFGLEAFIDSYIRSENKDFINTGIAGLLSSAAYGVFKGMSKVHRINFMKKGILLGLSLGFSLDLLIWSRGGRVWYMEKLKLESPSRKGKQNNILKEM